MLDLSKEASNTMEVIKITLHLASLMRQSWHQFHSNHKHWGSWLTHSENVDKCVNSSIITCPQGQSRKCLQISPWELVSWVTHNCATFLPPSPLLILQGPLGSDLWTLTCFLETLQHALVFLLISYFLPLTGVQYDIIISLIIMALEYGMLKGHKTLPCETDVHHFQTPSWWSYFSFIVVKTQVLMN